jgi:hypothetical protein
LHQQSKTTNKNLFQHNYSPDNEEKNIQDYTTSQKTSPKSFAYKNEASQIKQEEIALLEEFRTVRNIPGNPLVDLLISPVMASDFVPEKRHALKIKEKTPRLLKIVRFTSAQRRYMKIKWIFYAMTILLQGIGWLGSQHF